MNKLSPVMMVEDVPRSIEFYRDVLGFEVGFKMQEDGKDAFASLSSGEVEVMIQSRASMEGDLPPLAKREIGGGMALYVETEDLPALRERVGNRAELVSDIRQTPYGMTEFWIKDPSGYAIGFAQQDQPG